MSSNPYGPPAHDPPPDYRGPELSTWLLWVGGIFVGLVMVFSVLMSLLGLG